MPRVEILRSTPDPEKLVCQMARGDYLDGFVPDYTYVELMSTIDRNEHHEDVAREMLLDQNVDPEAFGGETLDTAAATYSLLEQEFKRGHWGIWEHPSISLAIQNVSRYTMAQLTRHRHASFDVQSMRYVDWGDVDPDDFKTPLSAMPEPEDGDKYDVSEEDRHQAHELIKDAYGDDIDLYGELRELGLPKEHARAVLPLGATVNVGVSMNAAALLHILNLRAPGDAQGEIRDLSDKLEEALAEWMPMTAKLWGDNGPMKKSP